ncbi:outer membrane protein [Sphingomonas solaris]|uniref:Porin family protein n=1 Tax=Alterirhizorhabdus solaris TaxID=2529389 RepID=A0A558QRS6_9SPHN|nr:outer membrane beta-barrel protein [Sphingomonas solaris]TVV69835.1 porin family protein [Sphingomonas solaris]
MKSVIAAAVLAAGIASPALAQDAGHPTFRLEAHGGWDRVQALGDHKDGVLYGIGGGVDVPLGTNVFVGLDANVEDSSAKYCESSVFTVGDRACVKTGRDLSVGGRIGTTLAGGAKIYALGAYTNARLKVSYTLAGTRDSESANGDGWRVGAGAQFPLSENLFVKGEYRYSNYEGDFSRHQVLGGVGINF